MGRGDQYIESDNSYYEPSRDNSSGTMMLVVVLTILSVILTSVLALIYFNQNKEKKEQAEASGNANRYVAAATPTPTPIPPIQSYQNAILYPATATVSIPEGVEIASGSNPSTRGLTQNVITGSTIVTDYSRPESIFMGDPLFYSQVAGVLTYRGNNFRDSAAFGVVNASDGTIDSITEVWEFNQTHSLLSSTMTYEWKGYQLTGQPLIVQWPENVRTSMNIYPDKVHKQNLTEVISACLDGYVYFFDIEDGAPTRDPIYVGSSIKGTPAVDPRGYPLLYIGQGDDNGGEYNGFGMYIYSLIDGSRLYFYEGLDDGAYRVNWGAFDSSPIIDASTDTLIWPCENGIIYTFKLNSSYTSSTCQVSVNPQCAGYKYIFNDTQGRFLGVESSIAVYGNYGYFIDNNSNLVCLDLNTFQMVWVFRTSDDSDVSPVVAEEDGIPYVYIGTEVDYQGGQGEYSGAAYTYKINGLTGEEVWQTSQPCFTYNGETSDTDQTGGCVGNPIIGRHNISNLVIFSYSMTKGLMSGNRIVAYDRNTGLEVWHYDMNIYTYSSPVAVYDQYGNAYIVVADSLGQIHMLNGQTGPDDNGAAMFVYSVPRNMGTDNETTSGVEFQASPAAFGNMIVIGTTSGSLFGIRIE